MKLELTKDEAQLLFNVLVHPDTKFSLTNASLVMPLAVKLQSSLPKPEEKPNNEKPKETLTKIDN